jgi:hypothetical protein
MQLFGRTREVQFVGHGNKVSQVTQFHSQPLE